MLCFAWPCICAICATSWLIMFVRQVIWSLTLFILTPVVALYVPIAQPPAALTGDAPPKPKIAVARIAVITNVLIRIVLFFVIPSLTGNPGTRNLHALWIPAFAGMTYFLILSNNTPPPQQVYATKRLWITFLKFIFYFIIFPESFFASVIKKSCQIFSLISTSIFGKSFNSFAFIY